jgi:hypothetical protein
LFRDPTGKIIDPGPQVPRTFRVIQETDAFEDDGGHAFYILQSDLLRLEDSEMRDLRPWLYIGTRRDVGNPNLLHSRGITASLQWATAVEQYGIASHFLPTEEAEALAPSALREGVDFVLDQKARGATVLISCNRGFSRSVALAAAVLKEAEGLTLSEALAEIRRRHPEAAPHPLLWLSLCEHYKAEDRSPPSRERGRDGEA